MNANGDVNSSASFPLTCRLLQHEKLDSKCISHLCSLYTAPCCTSLINFNVCMETLRLWWMCTMLTISSIGFFWVIQQWISISRFPSAFHYQKQPLLPWPEMTSCYHFSLITWWTVNLGNTQFPFDSPSIYIGMHVLFLHSPLILVRPYWFTDLCRSCGVFLASVQGP